MTSCHWQNPSPAPGEHFVCTRCGTRIRRDGSIAILPYRRRCKEPRPPCVHLGEQARKAECQSCAGRVLVKVFACRVHGECTLRKSVEGVAACCEGCGDHSAG